MAEEASRSTNSVTTIRSGRLTRRNSLPLFQSDLGKDVPGYLRASTGSCHDHCKYGRKEMCEVMQKRPVIKRPVAARELKALDKSRLGQNDGSKIHKPQTLPSNKTPETSCRQFAPRDKDIITKSSESFPKSAKSRLLKGKFMTRESASTLGNEKLPGEKECVPWSGDLRDAKSFSRRSEGGNVIKLANGSSTNGTMKLNAKAKASPSPAPTKIVASAKPLSSLSPPRVRPAMKARPQSSSKKSKPVNLRVDSSSSPTKSRPVSVRVSSSCSPIRLKPAGLKVNSLSSPGSFKAKKSPPSISPRSVSSKKSIIIRSQIVKTGRSSKARATEAMATRRGSVSSDFKDVANYEKEELQQENLVDAQIDHKNGLKQENQVEEQIDETNELQEENQVEEQIEEMKEVFETNEENLSYETELQNQEEVSESYDNEASEKTLYVIETDAGNDTQPAPNAEDEIPDMQLLASASPLQSPSSPTSVTESNMSTEPEASLMELTNTDKIVPCADQETLDIEPLPSLSAESLPESQSSIVASNESPLNEVCMGDSIYTETTVPCADHEALLDIEPLSFLSPEILPESKSSVVASNEASLYEVTVDGSVYTDSEEGHSSYEDEHLIEGGNLTGDVDTINLNKKSKIVTSQENSNDAVKLSFKKGRVIDITQQNQGPRRLKFRRARVLDEKTVNNLIHKRSFKITEPTQVDITTENKSSSVVLRHQDTQDKKDAQVLFNNVIEETANKLVEKRKSMVKALVGAFETVISLQDGKPATAQQDQ